MMGSVTDGAWYIATDGCDPIGPVATDLVVHGIEAGKVPLDAQVCAVGSDQWVPLVAVEDFSKAVREMAPPPPPPPPQGASRSDALNGDLFDHHGGATQASFNQSEAQRSGGRQWYVSSDGNTVGPVPEETVVQQIMAHSIPLNAYVGLVGGTGWVPISSVEEFERAAHQRRWGEEPQVASISALHIVYLTLVGAVGMLLCLPLLFLYWQAAAIVFLFVTGAILVCLDAWAAGIRSGDKPLGPLGWSLATLGGAPIVLPMYIWRRLRTKKEAGHRERSELLYVTTVIAALLLPLASVAVAISSVADAMTTVAKEREKDRAEREARDLMARCEKLESEGDLDGAIHACDEASKVAEPYGTHWKDATEKLKELSKRRLMKKYSTPALRRERMAECCAKWPPACPQDEMEAIVLAAATDEEGDALRKIYTEAKDSAPQPVSLAMLHQMAATGMTVRKPYKVCAYLSEDGDYLKKAKDDWDKSVDVVSGFGPGHPKGVRLYNMRGRQGCFEVQMIDSHVAITDLF